MKFIHCADLHLDSKMDKLSSEKAKIRREEVVHTFERLTKYAVDNGVKAVIISGDMFDTAKVTIKTREKVMHAISSCPSVDFLYLSGNHDEENFISSVDNLPNNLKIFNDAWSSFRYENVVISGIVFTSFNTSTVYDNLSLDANDFNIVAMHGQIVGYKSQDKAETISLPRLKDKNIDYLALGHIHEFVINQLDLRGKYAYSGCLEGRGFDETGDKGFVEIEVEVNKADYKFIPFAKRSLYNFEYIVEDKPDFFVCKNEIVSYLKQNIPSSSLVKVILKGERSADFIIDELSLSNELNEQFFFAKVYDKTEILIKDSDYELDKTVRGEFVRAVWESELSSEIKSKILTCGLNALKGEDL